MIIKLLHSSIKFRSILIKFYFINNQKLVLNNSTLTNIPLIKSFIKITPIKIL